jgi:hypothetical protein
MLAHLGLAAALALASPAPQTHSSGATPAAWPAPVGHRQPRAADIPMDMAKKRDLDAELERLDRALDGKLKICRGC